MVEEGFEKEILEDIEIDEQKSRKINYFEKFLPLWVAICIIIG